MILDLQEEIYVLTNLDKLKYSEPRNLQTLHLIKQNFKYQR